MKNKPNDTPYCGVRKKVIQRAEPILNENSLRLFNEYITERYRIHVRKDVRALEPPYTDNPILQEYKFTNIRREHDKNTRWLIYNIAHSGWLSYRQKLMNCILFRLYNKWETMEVIGAPFKFEGVWHITEAKKRLVAYKKAHPGYKFYTNAFMTSGLTRALGNMFPKETVPEARILRFMKYINENGFMRELIAAESPQEVFELLDGLPCIGGFLAYQIFVDFTYIDDFPFSENEYTVTGPGCKAGINYLFDDKKGMNYEECLFWLRDNWAHIAYDYDILDWFDPEEQMVDLKHYDRTMNVMSLENCMCEFSKYYKVYYKLGRTRCRYKPK